MTIESMDSRLRGNDGVRKGNDDKGLCSPYCPIREISVERGGMRVKKFNVFEDVSSELLNSTEYRQSGTPGDLTGAVFLVLFYTIKIQIHICYTMHLTFITQPK
jgi:hypothetical protein